MLYYFAFSFESKLFLLHIVILLLVADVISERDLRIRFISNTIYCHQSYSNIICEYCTKIELE